MFYLALIAPLLNSALLQVDTIGKDEKQETAISTTTPTQIPEQDIACNCVAWTRIFRPDLPNINAEDIRPTSDTPWPGAVAIMRYQSGAHHVAYVSGVVDGMVHLHHANVVPCHVTDEWMPVDNSRLLGYR